mgnify:FL=1
MKTFLQGLSKGLDASLNTENKELLRILESLKAISKYHNKFYLNNNFVIGKLDISQNATGYLNAYDERFKKDLLIQNRDLNAAHLGDIVLAKILKSKKDRVYAKILAVLVMANATSVVYTKRFGNVVLGVNIQNGLSLNLRASQKSLKALPDGSVLKINNLNNEIIEVLGVLSDPSVDEKISLSIYNKQDDFALACENEARAYGDSVDISMYKERVDLSDLAFCSIDPDDAKDYDDAIFYDEKENALYVAIADVSEYVQNHSATDKAAKFRGFSIYFPHKCVPMLPRNLSENICSLKPDAYRLAFIFKLSFDVNFNVIKDELFEGLIKSRARLTYGLVDEVLKGKKYLPNQNIQNFLLKLAKITEILRQKRLLKGFDFRSKELKMSLDEAGLVKSTHYESDTPSHALIEDCMLLANIAAAKRINKGIFRNHEPADMKKILYLIDDLAALGINATYESDLAKMIAKIQAKADEIGIREDVDKLIIKAQKRAQYNNFSSGHFGLGFDTYTHFTSPIRRYSDLILHRLLKAKLKNDEKLFNYLLETTQGLCESLNVLEREADKVAFDFMDRKFARWASANIGNSFICYISQASEPLVAILDDEIKGARIFLPNYSCEILTKVLVRIVSSDIASTKIIGKVIKKLS